MPGSIVKRGKNSWSVIVDFGRDPVTGKRRQLWRSVKGPKRDAQVVLTQLLHQRDTGVDAPPGKITVGEFLQRWLEDYARPNVAPKTLLQYSDFVHRLLIPSLGHVPLTKLRPQHIQAYYSHALRQGRADGNGGLSPKTVLHIHRLLREALQHAVKWQVLARNPADAVDPPRPQRYEPPMFSPEEVRRLLAAADDTPIGALIHTAVMTGLRRGELLGLRWRDVDFDAGILHVSQAAQWLPHEGWSFRPPKTRSSRRPVALGSATITVLREHRPRQLEERLTLGAAYIDHDLVFASPSGTPIDTSHLRRVWERIVRASGLPHLRFHDLRHIHATLMLVSGAHPKIVSERLGHSGVGITLDTYSHVLPNLQAQAATGLERLLAAGGDA